MGGGSDDGRLPPEPLLHACRTPYELWHGKTPNLDFLHVFGCVAHVKTARPHLKKLEDRSTPMVLIGYEQGSKAYKLFDPMT